MGDTGIEKAEELLRGTEKAPEPGEELDAIIQKGTEDKPEIGGMTVTSAGHTIVYNQETGYPSTVNNNNLPAVLRKKRPNGEYVFGLRQTVKPKEGTFKCLLHKDDSNRSHYDTLGLAICPKDCLASPYEVRRHMQKRHKTEWGAIEDERKEAEKKEDRAAQRALYEAVTKTATAEAPLYVSNKDKVKTK